MLINNVAIGFRVNSDLCLKLCDGIDDAAMVEQPAPGVNHPAWILKHLSTYHPVIATLLRGGDPEDPKGAPFGKDSEPQADPAVYGGSWAGVVAEYREGKAAVEAALGHAETLDPGQFFRKMPVERWRERFPTAGSILAYLAVHHEAFHIGQLSTWRRVKGFARI